MLDARQQSVAQLAETLACSYFPTGRVDPEAIISDQGNVTFSRSEYGDYFDGQLQYVQGQFHIFCNTEGRNERRQRFTLGHELGHYFIDEHRLWLESHPDLPHCSFCLDDSDRPGKAIEVEADCFAASLLLPERSLRKKVGTPAATAEVILNTADYFDVSLTATALRFANLELFPCVLMHWDRTGTRTWIRASAWMFQNYGGRVWRSDLQGMDDSVTARVLRDPDGASRIEEATSVLEAWYPGLEQRMNQHKRQFAQCAVDTITEYALNLGPHGVLTVLTSNELWKKWRTQRQSNAGTSAQ